MNFILLEYLADAKIYMIYVISHFYNTNHLPIHLYLPIINYIIIFIETEAYCLSNLQIIIK